MIDNSAVVDVHAHYHCPGSEEKRLLLREPERNNVAVALVSSIGEKHEPRPSSGTVRECNRSVAGLAKEKP